MPDKEKSISIFGRDMQGFEVAITSAHESFSDYELEDGTLLRVKSVATGFTRLADQYMPDGKPIYIVNVSPVVSVLSSPHTKA